MKRYAMMLSALSCVFAFPLAAETYTSASYVLDGLVGHWDGIDNAGVGLHVANTNYWTDLTGQSGDFAVFSGVASFTADGLKKNAQGVMATNVTANARSDVRTIEVVVSGAPASGWVHAFLITKDQTVSLANGRTSGGDRDYFFDCNNFGWRTLLKPAQETVAVIYESSTKAQKFRQNGVSPTGSKITNNWGSPRNSSAMHIGGRTGYETSGDYTTKGYTIHAVRLYSRALSDAEIKRNATIDQIRFFGAPAEIMPSSSKYAVVATAGVGGLVAADDVNAAPDATAKNEVSFSDEVYPVALRAIPLQGWKFSGWTGDFSCVTEGSASTPVIVLSSACGRVYRATFVRDQDNPEIPYVTDGLVGRWDGIENAGVGIHNTSTNRWVDLSGQGGDFLVLSDTASFSDTGLTKNAAGVCATNLLGHSGALTVEGAVSGVPSSGWLHAVFINADQTITLRNETSNKRQFFFDNNHLKWKMDGQPDAQTISVTYAMEGNNFKGQAFYLDGATPQNGSIDGGNGMYWYGGAQTNTWVGGRMSHPNGGDYTAFGYTVHALRFYNRVLSAGEIAYNSAVDRLRFRGLRKEGFAYRLVNGNVQCQLRAWTDGMGGTVKMDDGAATTDGVATAWVDFGTQQTATFTAQPADGWKFLGWAGDTGAIVSGTVNDRTVGVSAANGVALQAVFTQTSGYVQDGLIGFWDAKENAGFGHYDANASAWKDLTGISGDFNLNAASGVFEADALYKVRRGRMAFNAVRRTDVRTVEAVVSPTLPINEWALPIFVSHKQHISIKDQGEGSNRLYFFDRNTSDTGHYGWQTPERPMQMTVTVLNESATSAVDFFVNAVKPEGSVKGNWWGDSPGGVMTIGARGPVSGGDATATGYRVHAIRFYNRQLTPAEIKRNARHDGYRYFGARAPGQVVFIR
ncbi:MAG: hypothetical protein K6G91_01450 [Kiritimatiellae bacterium]|nr:hypothetical protein [Kiritimatiellia bacterium]